MHAYVFVVRSTRLVSPHHWGDLTSGTGLCSNGKRPTSRRSQTNGGNHERAIDRAANGSPRADRPRDRSAQAQESQGEGEESRARQEGEQGQEQGRDRQDRAG